MFRHRTVLFVAVLAFVVIGSGYAQALDKLRAGKAEAAGISLIPLDIGSEAGLFNRYGIEIEITAVSGGAKLQQAMLADSIDVGVGGGPAMAFTVKGSGAIAVAAFAGKPVDIGLLVAPDSPIKTVADLKGKLIGITTAGSLTEWLAKRVAVQQNWGADGVRTLALGNTQAMIPALKTHQIDAFVAGIESALLLEDKNEARLLTAFGDYAPEFIDHVVFASKKLVASNPELVNRFLKAFFASIQFMHDNKDKTVEAMVRILHDTPAIASRAYDTEMSMFSADGRFDPKAVAVIKASFQEMGLLETTPSDNEIFTTQFLPVQP